MRRKSAVVVLMERDGLTLRQAKIRVDECRRALEAAMDDGAGWELDDIVRDYLGLDSRYVNDLI